MSAQSAKKKRIGSRRRVANQNKTTNADEFHIPDSVSVAEPYTPEENTESLNVLANPDHLQSETPNPPSPELTTNRRKLGSSRRNKGGQRVKDSATESYHKPSEEIEEKTRDDETPQTTQMSLAMQSQRQEELSQGREHDIMSVAHDSSLYSAFTPDYSSEVQYSKTNYPDTDQESFIPKSENLQADQDENDENKIESDSCTLVETVLIGTTKSDTLQSEELEENADLVGTSELTSLSVLSCPTVDQQLIDQSELRKIPEELECVYSVTEEDSKERDKDTEPSKQNGNLQGNYLVCESHAKSVVTQFSATPELTTDKSSPRENTKLEYIFEQATFLTPNKELPKDEEQNEHFSLSEVSSEDAVNKIHEIDHSSESVTHDAAEKSEITSGNLIDRAEVSDTSQSELVVKSNDDSTTKQEDSNSDDGQDDHPTKENNFGALEHTNEDYHVYDTKKLQSSGIERGDTAQNQVYEDDGQEGDDRKSSAKQTVHWEKQGLFSEMEERNTSLQTVQSETNASLDSQPLQNDTGFNTFGNRRKLGSSRRNKGRQHFKERAGESYHEHKESTTGNKALETTEMSAAIERTNQEELSQGSEHDVIMPATHDSNLQDHDDHDFKMEVSDKSVGVTSEGMDESGTLQEVLGAHLSEDAVNKVHGQEVNPTHDTDRPYESVTNDATENSEIISENLIEQAEVSDTYQSELVMKRTDDSATRQDDSNPDDGQDDHPSKENSSEALEHKHDNHVDDIKSSAEQTHDEEKGRSESSLQTLQSEANAPLDSQPLDNSVRIEEQNDTGLTPVGSSHRNKVRQQAKESVAASYHEHKKEVLESTGYNETLETTQMLVTIERTSQKELSQEGEHGVIMSATHDIIPDSFGVLNPTIPTYPETNLESLTHTSENLQEEYDQTETDFKVEVFDESVEVERIGKSETLQSQEVRGAQHSEDAVKQPHEQVNPTQMHEMPGIVSSQSMLHDADDTDDSATKHEDSNPFDKQDEHPTEENDSEVLEQTNEDYHVHDTKKLQIDGIIGADTALGQLHEIEGKVENDIKPSAEQTVHQEKGLSESHLKSEDIESSITPEISTEKHSVSEHTQAECSVEQAMFSSTKEELPTNEEQSEHSNLSEAKDAQYSEDAVSKVCEQEVKTTQVHEIEHSPESVTHEATENPEIIPGNLIDQANDTDTYQSELIVKSTDDSTTRQEDSNFDDKQDEHLTKENSEALEHTNEDYRAYDTKKQPTRGIENADTEVSQVYEIEGQVEDDIKPNAEQAVHQERQGLSSEIEQDDDSPLQSLQSESNAPLDSKPQHDDPKFNPIGNRRKLGSSRRNKGRPHAKESVVESYHRPTEEASGNTKENEPLETIKMSLTIETAVQENSMETTLEGMDSYDTVQTEEVSDQVKENPRDDTLGGISELTASNLHSSLTVNQQLIDQSNSTEMPDEELPSVSSVTVKESNERDEDSELLSKDGNLEDDNLVSESHLKSEDMDSSITLKITTERQSPREHTQPECSVGQAICSSPKEELPSSEEQIEHFSLPEVKGAQHSEDFVNKVHEQQVNPTQIHEIGHPSESVTHDVTENSELISANLINQAEVGDTHQSELVEKSTDDFASKQEDSNPDVKQDDDSTKEDNFKALEQTNEDYHVSDTKKQQTSVVENEDTALGQVYEIEGQVEDDIKPCAERTGYQDKEGIFPEMEKSESSLQALQDTNAPLDFQPQIDSLRTEEQIHTGFNPIGNRRKLGSSRRNKGRQQVKGSVAESSHEHKDVLESTRGNETLETTHMLMTIEKTSQEELSQEHEHDIIIPVTHDSSLYSTIMPDSSEVQNPASTNYPEAVLESLNSKSERLQEDCDERETDFKVDVPVRSLVAKLEGINKSNTLHEQEINPTQKHEMEHFSESVMHDVTENPEFISANLIKQTEVSDTHQSELIVKSTDDFATKQEDSNPDAKLDDDSTKEDNFKALEQTNEDYDVYDTNKQETSGIENKDTALGQVYEIEGQVEDDINPSTEHTVPQEKQGLLSDMEEGEFPLQTLQSEINAPLDSQPLQNNTNIRPIGNRRKLGSSRRNKGRQHAKDSAESCHRPTEEAVGSTRDNELLEITKMSLTIETAGIGTCDTTQTEEVSDHVKENIHVGTLDGISEFTTSLHSSLTVDHQIVHQSNITEMAEQELPNVSSVTAKESNERDEDTELLSKDANLQDGYLDIESSMTPEITTEKNSPEHTDIECSGEQAAFTSPKEELSSNEEQKEHVNLSQVRGSLHVLNEEYEEAVKPSQTEETHQIDKLTYIEESESSLQTLQSEMNAPLDSQPLDTSARKEEKIHPGFNPTGNRRKLGSSRRNKGRRHVKDSVTETYHKPEEEFVVNTRGDEVLETTNTSLATETLKQEELKTQTDLELKATQKTRKKRSTVNDEEDTEKVPEDDGNTSVTTGITSSPEKDDFIKSNKDIDEEENNLTKEPENHLTGHDTVKTYSIQSPEDESDIQTISYHHDKATTKSVIAELLEQEDANKVRNTDTLSCDKDSLRQEIIMQQTNDAVETEGDIKIRDYNTGAECSVDVQGFGQDEAGEKSEDPAKKDHDPQGMDASLEITHAELFSAAHNKTDTFAPSDIRLEENFRAEPAEDVLEESGISTAVMQEKTNLDDSENSPEESKQKRRKIGSSRRIRLKRIPEEGMDNEDKMKESNLNMEADMKDFDKMEAVEELPVTVTAEVLQNENVKSSDLQSRQSHLASGQVTGGLTALLPGESASHNEDVIDHVTFVHVTDIRDREKNVDINIQPSQVDITYVQNYEDRSESANVIQDQALKSAEASVVAVADLEIVKNLEMKNASPNLNSPNRRRKMGSSRRSLGSQRKEEDLHQKPQVDNEATEAVTKVGDVKTESFPSIKEKEEPQLHIEDKDGDSEQGKEKVSEIVEYSHTGESHFKPPSHQTFAESPASQGQLVEMEPQLTPSYVPVILSTSPEHDVMSETAGGRRRKMGSHRKSHAHQNNENQTTREDRITDTQNVRECITEESSIKATEEESLGLDKRSEVDEGDKKPSSSISTSNAGELPKPVSEKTSKHVTPVQQPYAEIHLGQESQRTLSLAGSSGGTPLRSKSYNVMMVGDSSVGKTSFMKRAQSGKFSLDLPASVGLDSCMWTVVVDGKPVVLHLWDTAGQERFHSITRQIFHKAQAFLLMYDITSSQSFAAVSYWANCIQEGAAENVTILLLGNKSDCAERQVKTQDGESLAKEYNYEFMECSAATGENVIQSLETVARMLSQKVDTREETMVLHKEPQQKKSSGCC